MAKGQSAEYDAALDEAEEFEEVKGGDFDPDWDFNKNPTITGTFLGTKAIKAKGKDRTIHTVEVDGQRYTVWGTAILDSRLEDVEAPVRVRLHRAGKTTTQNGNTPWDWKVGVAKSALRQN